MFDRCTIELLYILLVDVRSIFDPRHLDASEHIVVIFCCIRHDLGNMFYVSVTRFHGCCENLPSHEATKPRSLEASKHRSASAGIAKRNQLLFIFVAFTLSRRDVVELNKDTNSLRVGPPTMAKHNSRPSRTFMHALTTAPSLGAPLRVALADIISKSLG